MGQKTVNLEKLRSVGLGTNQVEEFAKKDMGRGSSRRRRIMIKAMMRGKVEEAKVNNSSADIKINSMVEFLQAAVPRVITTITGARRYFLKIRWHYSPYMMIN